jgi:membrane associated rhomboid family serine protease
MSSTIITANATLFGLSTLSTAIYLDITRRKEKAEQSLRWDIMVAVASSFLSFLIGLFSGFMSLSGVDNKTNFAGSMGGTLSGAALGSLLILLVLRDYMRSREHLHTV